jgi:hypothetical protein
MCSANCRNCSSLLRRLFPVRLRSMMPVKVATHSRILPPGATLFLLEYYENNVDLVNTDTGEITAVPAGEQELRMPTFFPFESMR